MAFQNLPETLGCSRNGCVIPNPNDAHIGPWPHLSFFTSACQLVRSGCRISRNGCAPRVIVINVPFGQGYDACPSITAVEPSNPRSTAILSTVLGAITTGRCANECGHIGASTSAST